MVAGAGCVSAGELHPNNLAGCRLKVCVLPAGGLHPAAAVLCLRCVLGVPGAAPHGRPQRDGRGPQAPLAPWRVSIFKTGLSEGTKTRPCYTGASGSVPGHPCLMVIVSGAGMGPGV